MKVIDIAILISILSMLFVIDIDKEVVKGIITGVFAGGYFMWRYK